MKELTQEQKEFVDKVVKHRKEQVEELAYRTLAVALNQDIPVFELPYYVLQRARQVVEEAYKGTSFDNPKLRKLRMEYLKECLKEMNKNLKFAEKKEEKDETDKRDNECEPVVKELVTMVLDDKLVFSDPYYFDEVLKQEEGIPLSASIAGYMDALDEKLLMVIGEHWRRATEKMFGVDKESVRFSMLDAILKKE